jgi:hypothetical protein
MGLDLSVAIRRHATETLITQIVMQQLNQLTLIAARLRPAPKALGLVAESISRSVIRAYREFVMGVRVKKLHPALKHGGYSAIGLIPGEDAAAFEQLHRDLRATCCPDGPLEEHTTASIGNLLWRKQNLGTFRRAEAARERYSAITSEMVPSETPPYDLEYMRNDWTPPTRAEVRSGERGARDVVDPDNVAQ